MRASIISAIATLASFAVAIPVKTTVVKRDKVKSFLLKPAEDSVGLGHVQWGGTVGGDMGWFPSNDGAKDASVFIQFNAREGIAFYSQDTAVQVYLKPSNGTCQYVAKIGNPDFEIEAEPTIIPLTDNFTLDTNSNDNTENFGYLHEWSKSWTACGGADETWTLCYGKTSDTGECKESFSLVTEYQTEPQP